MRLPREPFMDHNRYQRVAKNFLEEKMATLEGNLNRSVEQNIYNIIVTVVACGAFILIFEHFGILKSLLVSGGIAAVLMVIGHFIIPKRPASEGVWKARLAVEGNGYYPKGDNVTIICERIIDGEVVEAREF